MDEHATHQRGRPRSWVMVAVMVSGFAMGGVALTRGPAWEWLAAGVVVFLLGGAVAVGLGIFDETR